MSSPFPPRIPFAEAVEEDLLFKRPWLTLSKPQRAVLKAAYGLPLDGDEKLWWSAFNGYGQYDELGFLTGVTQDLPYTPQEYDDITLIFGRRAAKTTMSSFAIAYEAICGGHRQDIGRSARQLPLLIQVAQDLNTGRANLRQFIMDTIEQSPIGKTELGDLKVSVTADEIRLKHALIVVGPPSIKLRGQAIAVAAMDELAVWAKDSDAAMPDYEVERAIKPAMSQFSHRKLWRTSSPMTEEGRLWEMAGIGTRGCYTESPKPYERTLVLRAPTAALQNPGLKNAREYLAKERLKDADAFSREYLAQFSKSISGFLSPALLRAAIEKGVTVRPPLKGQHTYVAALDPAFRKDAFAFCLGHLENGKFVLDVLESWRGTKEVPVSPSMVLAYVGQFVKAYGVGMVMTDQYQAESLQELAQLQGFLLEPVDLTNSLKRNQWGEFSAMLNQGRLRLLDHPELIEELMKMERKITSAGTVQFSGVHDDHAMVTVLCLHRCLQFGELSVPVVEKPLLTHADIYWDLQRKRSRGRADEIAWYH